MSIFAYVETAGPAVLGQRTQSLLGFTTCKNRVISVLQGGSTLDHQTGQVPPLDDHDK